MVVDLGSINPEIPTTGNSHNSTNANANAVNNKMGNSEGAAKKSPQQESGRKEKSVLQAKLTRLAIQIGYGGEILIEEMPLNCKIRKLKTEG